MHNKPYFIPYLRREQPKERSALRTFYRFGALGRTYKMVRPSAHE